MFLQSDSDSHTIEVIYQSNGEAGTFCIINENSTNDALQCETNGTGHALYVKGSAMRHDANPNWNIMSDRRLKKGIRPYGDGLDQILKINPMRFYYNGIGGFKGDQERVGIIAQDIQVIAPYMIKERSIPINPNDKESDEMMENAIEYDISALPYMLVNAIKELNQKVENLQDKNNILKSKIEVLSNN